MKIYAFFSEVSSGIQNRLMAELDSWFSLGGKRLKVNSLDRFNKDQRIKENAAIAACKRILIIMLAFILIPFILVACIFHYLMHTHFRCVKVPSKLSKTPVYKCHQAKIEEILDLLNLQTVKWPSKCLHKQMVFANEGEEKVIQEMRLSETEEEISLNGKQKLVRLLLMHFFNPPQRSRILSSDGHGVSFPVFHRVKTENEFVEGESEIRSIEEMWALLDKGSNRTIWFSVFFEVSSTEAGVLKEGYVGQILKRLNAVLRASLGQTITLVPDLTMLCFSMYFPGSLYWEDIQTT
ncbi:Family of unknown function (DUF648) [Chlamydia serpentis]|uniref:Uncharacterized protein n=1 Tax=Chlamydia serpentis TaxID=1967782 RepID=A0A2R8FCJ7_9CHLA|nr:DUF648 domain-containing protein [Chlamydia serpentis]SPN74081.1 Family of unknown function (DUF648) [Chlamydia serpentis]